MALNGIRYTVSSPAGGKHAVLSLHEGSSEIVKSLNRKIVKIKDYSRTALEQAANEVWALALELVPKDTLALYESSYRVILDTPRGPVAEIGFGQYGAPAKIAGKKPPSEYAVYVHENLEAQHPLGQAKYLEEAIKRKERRILEILAASVKGKAGV